MQTKKLFAEATKRREILTRLLVLITSKFEGLNCRVRKKN